MRGRFRRGISAISRAGGGCLANKHWGARETSMCAGEGAHRLEHLLQLTLRQAIVTAHKCVQGLEERRGNGGVDVLHGRECSGSVGLHYTLTFNLLDFARPQHTKSDGVANEERQATAAGIRRRT